MKRVVVVLLANWEIALRKYRVDIFSDEPACREDENRMLGASPSTSLWRPMGVRDVMVVKWTSVVYSIRLSSYFLLLMLSCHLVH